MLSYQKNNNYFIVSLIGILFSLMNHTTAESMSLEANVPSPPCRAGRTSPFGTAVPVSCQTSLVNLQSNVPSVFGGCSLEQTVFIPAGINSLYVYMWGAGGVNGNGGGGNSAYVEGILDVSSFAPGNISVIVGTSITGFGGGGIGTTTILGGDPAFCNGGGRSAIKLNGVDIVTVGGGGGGGENNPIAGAEVVGGSATITGASFGGCDTANNCPLSASTSAYAYNSSFEAGGGGGGQSSGNINTKYKLVFIIIILLLISYLITCLHN